MDIVTDTAWMLRLSLRPSTIVKKEAITRLLASVPSNFPASSAQSVPLAMLASSQGKRARKARQGLVPSRTCARVKAQQFKHLVGA